MVAAPLKGTKLKDIREVGEAIEDSPPKSEEGGGEALTEEQILGLIIGDIAMLLDNYYQQQSKVMLSGRSKKISEVDRFR